MKLYFTELVKSTLVIFFLAKYLNDTFYSVQLSISLSVIYKNIYTVYGVCSLCFRVSILFHLNSGTHVVMVNIPPPPPHTPVVRMSL